MTTLTNNDLSAAVASSTLSLRIAQPGADDRTITLPTGKCTVGSSDRCQVHLTDAQVRPLHCLIVHEATGTLVTRWAPGVQLNGEDFATAPFQPGDCLQIGEVQMLLVAENVAVVEEPQDQPELEPESTPVVAVNNAFAMPSTVSIPKPTAPVTNAFEAEHLKAANEGARKRCRKLVGVLRTMRTEASSFDQRINDLEQQLSLALVEREQIHSQLSQLQGEAGERENQSSEEVDRLISELTAAYEKSSVAETALAEHVQQAEQFQLELASLQGEREQWKQVRSAGELQRSKLAQALADREKAIETLQAEIDQSRESARNAENNGAEQTATLEALQAELEQLRSEREQIVAERNESRQRQQEAQQSQADSEQNLAVFQLELEKFQITSRQTEHELSESKTALENLQAEFAPLSNERDELVTKRTEYQLREQGWEHELLSRDSLIEDLTGNVHELQASIGAANQEAASQVSQTENFEQQLGTLAVEREQLLAAQAEQGQKLSEWEETVAARDRRIKELEEEHVGICEMLQSVEKGAFEQVDSCNKLEEQLTNTRAERDQLAEAMPAQQEAIKQLEQALAERDGQITLLSDELTKTTQGHMQLETELAEGSSAYQALEGNLTELTTRCEELIATQDSSDQGKATVEQALTETQGQVDTLQQQLETAQQQRQELEQTLAQGSQSSETIQAEFNDLQARYEQLVNDHQAETDRRHERDQQLAGQQQDVELFQVDLKSVQAELERTVGQVSSLETERETMNQQLLGLREELASQEETAGDGASVSEELLSKFEEEKSLLVQQVQQQAEQTEQLAGELEQAHQCLHTAEQALLQRAEEGAASPIEALVETPIETPEEASNEPVAWSSEPDAPALEETTESVSEEFEITPEPEPTVSTSTAFDRPVAEPEEETPEFQPASFIDQFQGMLEEDGDEANMEFVQSEPEPAPVANKLGAEIDAMGAASDEEPDDEADLEAYMSNMLRRMRGDESDDEATPPQASSSTTLNQNPNPVAAVDEVLGRVAPERETIEEPENLAPMNLEELKQSSSKPTLPTDLSAMRELANSSARRAISKHHKRLHREKALGWFLGCLLAIGLGGYMLLKAIAAQEFLGLGFLGGATGVLVGVVAGFKLLGQLLLAIRDGSQRPKSAKKTAE